MLNSAERLAMDAEMSKPASMDAAALQALSSDVDVRIRYVIDESPPSADAILEQARKEQADRAQFYDAPAGERSMSKTVTAFNAIFGTQLTEVQGWQFMELLKMVRSTQGKTRFDNHVDGASYAALAGEAAMKETK